jgi:DNA-binding LacI/PurR family transcriptional regulator
LSKRFDDRLGARFHVGGATLRGEPVATMHDIAKLANVAVSPVSYALNGTRPISAETRQRIAAAMEELGYRPNALARALASKRSRIIALLFPPRAGGVGTTDFEIVTGAADAAREHGYHLLLSPLPLDDTEAQEQLTTQGLIDGAVVMEIRLDDARVDLLRETGTTFSIIGRTADTTGISYVDIDFEQTTHDAVRHLVELGHEHIAFLNHSQSAFDAGYGPSVRAQAAFEVAVAAAGLRPTTRMCEDSPRGGRGAFEELIAAEPRLTALVAMNEGATVGSMHAIASRGWRVPDDFAIVSIASTARAAEMTQPALTTMEAPSAELGRTGVEALLRQLDDDTEPLQRVLPCRLVVRGSSGPRRQR